MFTKDEKETVKEASDRRAIYPYVMVNGGETDTYIDKETAFDIRESLSERYENIDPLRLSGLTQLYCLISVTRHEEECLDKWFSDIRYYMNLIVEAGQTRRTDKEIIAQIVTSVPMKYEVQTTLIKSWYQETRTTTKIFVGTQIELRKYWKRNYKILNFATTFKAKQKFRNVSLRYDAT